MRDVARAAGGVHPSTVSLALRDDPVISGATRRRIQAAARQLGYRPDPMLTAFNRHRLEITPHKDRAVIACVFDFPTQKLMLESPGHRRLFAAAQAAADSLHRRLEPFFLPPMMTPERLSSILIARGTTALVVAALGPASSLEGFRWDEFAAVRIESMHCPLPRFAIATNHRLGARDAYRRLRSNGRIRIGLVLENPLPRERSDLWRAAFLIEQMREPPDYRVPILEGNGGRPMSAPAMRRWIKRWQVDAVITDSAQAAALAPHAAVVALTSPEDGVHGIVPDTTALAQLAVKQVVMLSRAHQRGQPAASSCTFIEGTWFDGLVPAPAGK